MIVVYYTGGGGNRNLTLHDHEAKRSPFFFFQMQPTNSKHIWGGVGGQEKSSSSQWNKVGTPLNILSSGLYVAPAVLGNSAVRERERERDKKVIIS
jgi:hypothetical protein